MRIELLRSSTPGYDFEVLGFDARGPVGRLVVLSENILQIATERRLLILR